MALPAAHDDYEVMIQSRPGRMMVELHDEAIVALKSVIDAISAGDIETRFNETAAAMQAVTALHALLDQENGGELASNLGRIYNTVLAKLGRIAFTNDAALARDSVDLLAPLREAWDDLDRRASGEGENRDHARAVVAGARAKAIDVNARARALSD